MCMTPYSALPLSISITVAEVNATVYYRQQFDAICNPKNLTEYIVMDIEVILSKDRHFFPGQGKVSQKHVVSDIWLTKASELGINDNTIHTKTHLGHLLKPGDSVLGYNLEDANINDIHYDKLNKDRVPDVVLVKKCYGDNTERRTDRIWKLKHLDEEATALDKSKKYELNNNNRSLSNQFLIRVLYFYSFAGTTMSSWMTWRRIHSCVKTSTFSKIPRRQCPSTRTTWSIRLCPESHWRRCWTIWCWMTMLWARAMLELFVEFYYGNLCKIICFWIKYFISDKFVVVNI